MTLFVVAEGFFDVALARFKAILLKKKSLAAGLLPLFCCLQVFWVEKLTCQSFAASCETRLFFALLL